MQISNRVGGTKEWQNRFLFFMFLISMTLSFVIYGGFGGQLKQAYQTGSFSSLLLVLLWAALFLPFPVSEERGFFPVCLLIFGMTFASVLVSVYMNTYLLWIGGCVLLAALFPSAAGMGFFLFFGCLFCFLNSAEALYEVFMFVLGIVLCGSVFFFRKKILPIVVIFLDLVFYVLLYLLLTRGDRTAVFGRESMISLIGLAIFLVLAYYLYDFFYVREGRVLDRIVRGDYPLLVAMRKYSKSLCVHCVDVSELSLRAARLLGCNERLCRAGGLYHDCGRLLGKNSRNYIANSVKLVKNYRFPTKVVDLIEQLDVRADRRRSKEAVIIIVTDTVLSMIDYMERIKQKKDSEMVKKMVHYVFERRRSEGIFENSEISEEELEILKRFLVKNSF